MAKTYDARGCNGVPHNGAASGSPYQPARLNLFSLYGFD
jgi:hypothetical protein